ncbi:MAG: hypothetical protein EHM45_13550 [Desulfobacteraceae bacterium]|nr:MAG: hypothetical protein EHM45_13550 [Desulfobacteraceae bacterium]
MPKAFFFDLNRCTGCGACIIACTIENSRRQTLNWRQVYTFNESHLPAVPLFNLSLGCNHCATPACVRACPALAIGKDPNTGAVIINPKHCLGCKYCTWACPYDAPRFNPAMGVSEKCDFCHERLKNEEVPACVSICPTHALQLGDRDEITANPVIPGFTEAGLQPAIRFKPLRSAQGFPECSSPSALEAISRLFESSQRLPPPKITLKSEWALLIFTSLAFCLVAFLTASLASPLRINPYLFIGTGAFAMGLSTIHLGRKSRAYRAIFNLKSSWLSREIFLFSAFLGLAFLYLFFFPASIWLGWITGLTGFLALFAIDRIYQVAMKIPPLNFHSAHTLFDGLYLTGALIGDWLLFALFGLIKLGLYLYRKYYFRSIHRKTRPVSSFLRLLFGFIIPGTLFIARPDLVPADLSETGLYGFFIASLLLGEWIDRTEFYDELEIVTPRKQMLIDLERCFKEKNKDTCATQ